MTMTRKEFLRTLVGAGVGAAGVAVIAGCGGDEEKTPDAAVALTCASPAATIGANHGHTLAVTMADVNAAADKTYSIAGTSPHDHTVTITAAQFAQLKTGTTLNITSGTGGGHTHTVTVMCPS